jgi:TetR/AcrR family transcriptional regulator, cholesterol catabolism regulator
MPDETTVLIDNLERYARAMPATRHQQARDEKVDELVEAAKWLFIENGFEATTMAGVAKEAAVASNVLYWYFDSKDHLFVAAMTQLVDAVIAKALTASRTGKGELDLERGLLSVVEQLTPGRSLIAAVHDRAPHSPVVAAFHDQVHARYAELLEATLRELGVPDDSRDLVRDALSTAVEGLVMHGASRADSKRMIHFLVERLVP